MLLTCTRKVSSSNIGRGGNFPDIFRGSLPSLRTNFWTAPQICPELLLFTLFSTSLFTIIERLDSTWSELETAPLNKLQFINTNMEPVTENSSF